MWMQKVGYDRDPMQPCSVYHLKSKQHPEDFVHELFKKSTYLEEYNPVVYPVHGEDFCPKHVSTYFQARQGEEAIQNEEEPI
jgi:hypothetical protein